MRDEEKSKGQLIQEVVDLRNKINSLRFKFDARDREMAVQKKFEEEEKLQREMAELEQQKRRDKEESQLKGIRDYATWVVYATPALLCALTPEGMTRFINPACEKLTGYRADELIASNWWKLLFPGEHFGQVEKLYRKFKQGDVRDYEMTLVTKTGQKCTVAQYSINRFDDNGSIKEIVLVGIDVTSRKRIEAQLETSEEKFRTLVSNIPCAIYRFANDSKLTILHITNYIKKICGYSAWDLIDNRVLAYNDIIHPEDKEIVRCEIKNGIDNRQPYIVEYRIHHADGSERWVHEKGQGYFSKEGKLEWIDGAVFDITDRKHMEKQLAIANKKLEELSITDELTHLFNRRGFLTQAEQQLNIAERHQRPVVILYADLNDMKVINDTQGHKMGDQALIETANILRQTFRKSDILARLGGDEFAVLAVETDQISAGAMAARLQECVKQFNSTTKQPFKISISTGFSMYDPANPASIEKLLESADKQMYRMKVESKKGR